MINKKGFSLVELIIAIVIIGILSIISIPIYKGYIEKAIISEAKAMMAEISVAQGIYYTKNKKFCGNENINELGLNFSRNKYFKNLSDVDASDNAFEIECISEDEKYSVKITEFIRGDGSYRRNINIYDSNENVLWNDETGTGV